LEEKKKVITKRCKLVEYKKNIS